MASSQVEIVLTSPFGCVLKKYNRREREREIKSFENDVRNFVRDHLNNNNSTLPPPPHEKNNKENHHQIRNINNVESEKEKEKEKEKYEPSRWAARKAREMVSTIETTEVELSNNFGSPTPPPPPPRSSSEISNRPASSLVQIWEKRLNNNNNINNQFDDSTSIDESSYSDSTSSSTPERVLSDTSSNETICSTSTQSQTQEARNDSDAAERVRVADIIKRFKLSCGDHDEQYCNSNMMISSSSSGLLTRSRSLTKLRVRPNNNLSMTMLTEQQSMQHTSFLHVLSSPRIRGRRAFTDLLMQMERDRHGELKLLAQKAHVSKFSQKGRIQSMLRLRLLQRRQAANGQCRQHSSSTAAFEVNKQPQGSAIMHLRERFNIKVENGISTTSQTEVCSTPRTPHNKNTHHSHTQINEQPSVIIPSSETYFQAQNNVDSQTHIDHEEEIVETQNVVESQVQEIVETITTTPSNVIIDSNNANEIENEAKVEEEEKKYNNSIIVEAETSNNYVAEEEANLEEQQYEENINYDEVDQEELLEGEGSDEQQYYDDDDETYFDWISHISRPRSYWEDRRQAWYKEMLDSTCTSDKQPEIRQLLERRTVSTFLSSDFRERMDKLMESHIGTQTHLVSSQEDDEDHHVKMDQLIQFLQQHLRLSHNNIEEQEDEGRRRQEEKEEEVVVEEEVKEEEEEDDDDDDDEEEEGSLNNGGSSYTNEEEVVMSDYFNQSSSSPSTIIDINIPNFSSSPSPNMSRWSYSHDQASEDSDRIESSSSITPQPSLSLSSSSTNPHSNIEMELICDLRGQMEQMHREMIEMRKSIKSCMDMQMALHQSMKREINTVKEKKKKSHDRPKKGNCCICYEKKVDSLLYRCGHMCACLKCANELQWNSGKCPICRAPIVDVVRVYVDA